MIRTTEPRPFLSQSGRVESLGEGPWARLRGLGGRRSCQVLPKASWLGGVGGGHGPLLDALPPEASLSSSLKWVAPCPGA